jgi:hypothetical protein
MSKAGILISGHRLQLSATTVRVRDERTQLSESHHCDAPEQLAGFYVVDLASTEEAISWASAARAPGKARSRCGRSGNRPEAVLHPQNVEV